MKFKTKLYLGLGSFLIIIIILVTFLINMFDQITVKMNVVVKELSERVNLTSTIQYEITIYDRELKGLTSGPPEDLIQSFTNNMEKSRMNTNVAIESLKKMDTREQSQELIVKFAGLYDIYTEMTQQIITLKKAGMKAEYEKLLWYDLKQIRERMLQNTDLLKTLQEQEIKNELFRTRTTYNVAIKMIYIYSLIGLVIGIGMIVWLILSITKNLNHVTSVMTKVTQNHGTKLPRIRVTSKDEIGAIAEAFNGMAQALEQHAKQEIELKEEAQENSWLKTKVAEIATMYPKVDDLQTLAQMFITKITPMVGASYGVFYTQESKGDQYSLRRLAAYASDYEQFGFESFRVGEGLVGQCAAAKQTILLNQVPNDHIKIVSGTGMSSPSSIIILPAEYEGEILAVIELASFEKFSPLQQKLLYEVMSNIGSAINSIASRMQVVKLLQESQALSEELQSQSEELQVQQEELRTTHEKLEEQFEHSEQKKKELEEIKLVLEQKAQHLALSSQYKSEFLANMSHELRTPLNSLLILTHILSENEERNLTDKQLEYVRTIYSSGDDLLNLINDILDLAKVESGNLEIISEELRLQDVQVFVENQFLPIARQKGIEFTARVDPDLPKSIFTDKHRLQQILKNLLSNAFKFTEKGSVSLYIQKAGSGLTFSVKDTGIGIPEEKQEMIFESFKQADGTTSRKYGGTGLGLPISREIAQLLGGFIQVKSEVDKGSTFSLFLPSVESFPLADNRSSEIEAAAAIDEQAHHSVQSVEVNGLSVESWNSKQLKKTLLDGKKVLIVDDDMRNIFALTTALEANHMEVIFAQNGREGIDILCNNPDTDLVLMDIMMPEMDGFEAIHTIRQMPNFQKLPIIALTAKAMKQDREECINAGASDYISKPINTIQLLSLIQVWVYR
ncbi:ATP-binding protein [Paenibacillus alkaliterrae]|uniref:ATP-binding protein n=1 Tax=Paenibacillus alkaliterrae TaxID=320909 RepID=UPI001F1C1D81|nr:ATP-binding protein [Paenibacillus alkaliterrae]MCF2941329.1 ATP-binding protein [Paenibacillus alkaliterrae]